MNIENKIFVITGAGSGIGRALAIGLSAKGARLLLVGRNEETLSQTVSMLENTDNAKIIVGDVTKDDTRKAIQQTATKEFGGIDVLINNAGVSIVGELSSQSDDDLRSMMEINLLAPMQLVRDLMDLLEKSESPRIVNVGSMFGDIAFPLFAGYSATKFGLRGLSDALRRELAPRGIGVLYAAPRGTETNATPAQRHLTEPFEMKLDAPMVPAANIISALESDARSSYPKSIERLFVLVSRLFPSVIDGKLIKQLKRVQTPR